MTSVPRASDVPQRRRVGNYTIEVDHYSQPDGWAWVRVLDINGAPWFAGMLPADEIALEVVVQLERAREYQRALTHVPAREPEAGR